MEKWHVRQSVVHVRVYLWHGVAHSLLRHSLIHSFIHIPPWVESQGGYASAQTTCLCCTRGYALSVCMYCGACGPFSARGAKARLSPLAEASQKLNPIPKGRPAPTAKVPHAPAHTLASLPPTFRGGGLLRIPGLHCFVQYV